MDIEGALTKTSRMFTKGIAVYALSVCLHAGLILTAWLMLSDQPRKDDLVEVELVMLAPHEIKNKLIRSSIVQKTTPGPVSRIISARSDAGGSGDYDRKAPSEGKEQDANSSGSIPSSSAVIVQDTVDVLSHGDQAGGPRTGADRVGAEEGSASKGKFDPGQNSKEYDAAILARIEAVKHYPLSAKRRNIQGKVIVSFRIDQEGRPVMSRIVQSSGSGLIDEAALDAVRDGAPYPKSPVGGHDMSAPLTVSIAFILK